MTFDEILAHIQELLQREQRVSYRGLKRRFDIDDEYLEDLKEELIGAKRLAVDEDGRFLVWVGATPVPSSKSRVLSSENTEESQETGSTSRPSQDSLLRTQHSQAERRQLTVMFCDLVGSTVLSTQLDDEDYHTVVQQYHQTCEAVVQRYGGFVSQHLGDGLLVYFGYPTAHEDEAQRAVRTALEIIDAVQALAFPTIRLPIPVQVRIGIHTGLVVIGEIGSSEKREMLALGETPNLAARVQDVAEPDTVAMSAVTQRLVQGLFECQALGPQALKGFPTPVAVYRVVGENSAQSRFEAEEHKGVTALVGREGELKFLQDRWEHAKECDGQVVLLSGEPGIGKSRLVRELRGHIEQDGAVRLEFRCSPHYQNSALHPIIEHLHRLLDWRKEDAMQTRMTKLQTTLARYQFPQADTPALLAWLTEEAEQSPLYCVWEDVHWADPSTLELLGRLIERAATTRLFLLLTSRPEFAPPWGQAGHVGQLTLSRLGRRQAPQMIASVVGGKPLPPEVVQQIVAKTDGVPLFVEELTKMVLESGLLLETDDHYELRGPLPPLAIPSTLQDSLMARLDRLAVAKEIAQLGATLGREFSYELLQAVSPLDAAVLQQGLGQLVATELVYQRGAPPQATYTFKHALIQDTAYQSLLKSRRQQLHQQVALTLEKQFPEIAETQPELLAHHYTEANLLERAISYWQQAGQRDAQRSAYQEAISHLTKGVTAVRTLPATPERAQQELALSLTLGGPLSATKGFTSPEVESLYSRARTLCQQSGETQNLVPALWGLFSFYAVRGDLRTAQELAEQMLAIAQNTADSALLLQSHYALGLVRISFGELILAQAHFHQTRALYDPQVHRALVFRYGPFDCGVASLSYMAPILWLLGYPDQAVKKSQETLVLAQTLAHPFSLTQALLWTSWFHQLRREVRTAHDEAEAALSLSHEQGFAGWLAMGMVYRGWALVVEGQGKEGLVQMQQGLTASEAIGTELMLPYWQVLLVEGHAKMGQASEGLAVLTEALAKVEKSGERVFEAELYRLKGELTLQSSVQRLASSVTSTQHRTPSTPAEAEAEACFLKAIEIAQKQQAKSLELRATMSLARLRQQQGAQHAARNTQHVSADTQHETRIRLDAARNMLSDIYNWFTEGFDTKDLQEARALLEESSAR